MKDRLITAAGALLALVVVYTAFFRSTDAPVTRPVTAESGRNGYAAVSRWIESAGVEVVSFRERYDRLIDASPDMGLPRRGNVMITTMPHLLPVRSTEHENLKAWIRSGNTLLILAALDDTPEWTPDSASARFLQDLQIMSGLRFVPYAEEGMPERRFRAPAETRIELLPAEGHPLMDGVSELRGYTDDESLIWVPMRSVTLPGVLLSAAVERRTGAAAAWQRAYGNGQIIVVASGALLSNHLVASADAGRFLANVVRYHVDEGGAVVFDDMHQGLSAIYDAAAFFRDPRLHRTMWFLLGAWLAYVLGSSNRFAPPVQEAIAPRQRDLIEAIGGFMARRLDRRDAARLLLDAWLGDVRRARGLDADEPPWDALRATPTLDAGTYEQLRRRYYALRAGESVDLNELHNLVRKAREAIG